MKNIKIIEELLESKNEDKITFDMIYEIFNKTIYHDDLMQTTDKIINIFEKYGFDNFEIENTNINININFFPKYMLININFGKKLISISNENLYLIHHSKFKKHEEEIKIICKHNNIYLYKHKDMIYLYNIKTRKVDEHILLDDIFDKNKIINLKYGSYIIKNN